MSRITKTPMFGGILEMDSKAPELVTFIAESGILYTGKCNANDYLNNIADPMWPSHINTAYPIAFEFAYDGSIRLEFQAFNSVSVRTLFISVTEVQSDEWNKPPPLSGYTSILPPLPINVAPPAYDPIVIVKNAYRIEMDTLVKNLKESSSYLNSLVFAKDKELQEARVKLSQTNSENAQLRCAKALLAIENEKMRAKLDKAKQKNIKRREAADLERTRSEIAYGSLVMRNTSMAQRIKTLEASATSKKEPVQDYAHLQPVDTSDPNFSQLIHISPIA